MAIIFQSCWGWQIGMKHAYSFQRHHTVFAVHLFLFCLFIHSFSYFSMLYWLHLLTTACSFNLHDECRFCSLLTENQPQKQVTPKLKASKFPSRWQILNMGLKESDTEVINFVQRSGPPLYAYKLCPLHCDHEMDFCDRQLSCFLHFGLSVLIK